MSKENLADIAGKLYALLEPLTEDERQRVIRGTRALLGENITIDSKREDSGVRDEDFQESEIANLDPKVKRWMKQNHVSKSQLDEVFHFDGEEIEIIAAKVPGSTKKDQTASAYLLCGAHAFLKSGEPKLQNSTAVDLCKRLACYDKNNHTANRNSLGNKMAGSIEKGFTLSSPGLVAAAEVIKQISSE